MYLLIKKIKSGFTLIEVLIVVAILAILTIAVLTSLSGQRQRAEDAKIKADLNRLQIAFEDYYNDHNCYPPTTWFDGPEDCGSSVFQPYLSSIVCNSHTGLPYTVTVDSTGCKWFQLSAQLSIAEIEPGCTGNNCPTTTVHKVASGNVDPYASSAPTPTPSASLHPSPSPSSGGVKHYYYYCSNLLNCTRYDETKTSCTPSYLDNADCDGQHCASIGSCTAL
jgi:prepilin-type N-terminal cleavage/methylation domain-containing protein